MIVIGLRDPSVYVYILLLGDGTFYCGITNNLLRRSDEHNNGNKSFASARKPCKIVWSVKMPSRKQAAWLEKKIKNRGVKKYLRLRGLRNLM